MIDCFKKDIFSKSKIVWLKKNNFSNKTDLNKYIKLKSKLGNLNNIYVRKGLKVNSKNFKIKIGKKFFLLKNWKNNKQLTNIERLNNINQILSKKFKYISKIRKINSRNEFLLKKDYYTLYDFIDGYHFSGEMDEFKDVSLKIGLLFKNLSNLDEKAKRVSGPKYFTKENDLTIKSIIKKRKYWNKIFGKKLGVKLSNNWNDIYKIYNLNKRHKIPTQIMQYSHYDLHPHNMIIKNKKLVAFLDCESLKFMDPGFSLAFACLKLSKQSLIQLGKINKKNSKKVVDIFIKKVSSNYPKIKKISNNFFYYSSSEVIRRILIILSLNLKGNKVWNKVLNIQIDHLKEAKILFMN